MGNHRWAISDAVRRAHETHAAEQRGRRSAMRPLSFGACAGDVIRATLAMRTTAIQRARLCPACTPGSRWRELQTEVGLEG